MAAPQPSFNEARGLPPSVENRYVKELQIDAAYQRRIESAASKTLINKIAKDWDWRLCMPLVVSKREAGLFVIDGQHRLEGARLRGDIPWLPCLISAYGGPAEEAAMFVAANRQRKPITRLEDFRAAIEAEDPQACEIKKAIDGAGLALANSSSMATWQPGEIAFISALARSLRKYPEDGVVPGALSLLAEGFKGQVLVHGSAMFGALVLILAAPPRGFDRAILIEALKMFDAAGWNSCVGTNTGGDQRIYAMRKAVLEGYDEKRVERAKASPNGRGLIDITKAPSSMELAYSPGKVSGGAA